MCRRWWLLLCLLEMLLIPGQLLAQDQNNPDALRKGLADTLAQLKAAQDRKNELANENDKLKAQLAAAQKELDELRRASAGWSELTFDLRARDAAWAAFVNEDPRLQARWELYLESGAAELVRDLSDSPLRTPLPRSIASTAPATTRATTQPAATTTTSAPTVAPSTQSTQP